MGCTDSSLCFRSLKRDRPARHGEAARAEAKTVQNCASSLICHDRHWPVRLRQCKEAFRPDLPLIMRSGVQQRVVDVDAPFPGRTMTACVIAVKFCNEQF
jgi:hypothetical protein